MRFNGSVAFQTREKQWVNGKNFGRKMYKNGEKKNRFLPLHKHKQWQGNGLEPETLRVENSINTIGHN